MSCEYCINTVTNGLNELDGVYKAKVNLKKKHAVVSYDESRVDCKDLKNAIKEADFEVMDNSKNNINLLLAISFVLLIGIVGCSDIPYSGPILSVDNVDRYLDSTGVDTVC